VKHPAKAAAATTAGTASRKMLISPPPSAHLQLFQPDFSQNYLQLSGT
jgi:hypothetical protein